MRITRVATLLALAPAFGCSKASPPEPSSSTSKAASPPAPSASSDLTPEERRDIGSRIQHEQCEQAAKHLNELEGRDATAPDPKTINVLSLCLRTGNAAWYRCTLGAKTADEFKTCTRRLL